MPQIGDTQSSAFYDYVWEGGKQGWRATRKGDSLTPGEEEARQGFWNPEEQMEPPVSAGKDPFTFEHDPGWRGSGQGGPGSGIPFRGLSEPTSAGGGGGSGGGKSGGGGSRTVRVGGMTPGQRRQEEYEDWQKRMGYRDRLGQEQFERYRAFMSPYLSQLSSVLKGAPGGTYDPDDPALRAMEESIERRGGEAQRAIASEMARRGVFRSGPSVAASALQQGETEAQVASTRGRFALAGAERGQRAWQARLSALMQLITSMGQSFPQGV